ncbi:hypothetical protein Poli38472_011559 [Pythium oligandrum]|uniref:Heme haloperoxidase family profile domain-containing protein n=1 Tax=Pythium oligandrum TaxID=41045 RepID=A0A8K1FKY4_PYTOL|nr:hypothetical protein Poli38472_011559 [Pythium oligandrum]|eukprot:TMW64679.1 hypothetical protein Poli38472_011559 [Pythium oligandrum]
MVSTTTELSIVFATIAAGVIFTGQTLQTGEFYKPSSMITSSREDSMAPFRRSPCPAVNTLANHGYLPRDGKNISKVMIREAMAEVFNLDPAFADTLLTSVPVDVFDLNLLGKHGLVEHDVSLVHPDSYYGWDPMTVDGNLAKNLLSQAPYVYGVEELGEFRRERYVYCITTTPNCTFGERESFLAFGESALLLDVLGGNRNSTITKPHLASFMVDERIPSDFVKSPVPVAFDQVIATSKKVAAIAMAPTS